MYNVIIIKLCSCYSFFDSLTNRPYHLSPGWFSSLHLLFIQSSCRYVLGRPTLACSREEVHRRMSLMISFLLLQQCPTCLFCTHTKQIYSQKQFCKLLNITKNIQIHKIHNLFNSIFCYLFPFCMFYFHFSINLLL